MLSEVEVRAAAAAVVAARPRATFRLSLPLADGEDAEALAAAVKAAGYFVMVETTAFGDELVVTDRVQHADAGPPRG
jgi:hypothetical protein